MADDIFIAGVGSYVPPTTLTNNDIEKFVHETPDWIKRRTGISERRIADPTQNTSDLALLASNEALCNAGLKPEQIDLIIFATITPDTQCPSAANWLQDKFQAIFTRTNINSSPLSLSLRMLTSLQRSCLCSTRQTVAL